MSICLRAIAFVIMKLLFVGEETSWFTVNTGGDAKAIRGDSLAPFILWVICN